jgi:hypothetical protein
VAIKQAKVRKRAEGLGEGAEEIEDVTYRKKDEKTKQSSKRRSEDDGQRITLAAQAAKTMKRVSKEALVEGEKGDGARRARAGDMRQLTLQMRIGQLVTAVDDFAG